MCITLHIVTRPPKNEAPAPPTVIGGLSWFMLSWFEEEKNGFPTFWPWAYLIKIIPETGRTH